MHPCTLPIYLLHLNDLQGNQMKASAVSIITKSLPIALPILVNYFLLASLGYIEFFIKNRSWSAKYQRVLK